MQNVVAIEKCIQCMINAYTADLIELTLYIHYSTVIDEVFEETQQHETELVVRNIKLHCF